MTCSFSSWGLTSCRQATTVHIGNFVDSVGAKMRRTTALLTIIFTPAAFVWLSATPADATPRNFVCETGEFCVYTDLNWGTSGDWKDLPNAVSDWNNGDYLITNKDSGWRNKYVGPIRAYNGSSYGGGTEVCINPGIARTAGFLSTWDDDGQSNHNIGAC
jgi:hypothetical protein